MKKYLNYKIGVLFLIFILSYMYWDKPIEREYSCIEFNLDENEFENIKVSIVGNLKRSLLRKDRVQLNITMGNTKIPNFEKYPNVFPLNSVEK